MNDAPRRTLRELIARHGPGLCGDARRCEGLLRDLCGEHRREINILVGALRERVPLDLLAGRSSVPTGLLLTRLSKRLEDHLALTEDASRWAVDSWALALGVVSDGELDVLKGRRDESPPPRVEAAPTTAPRPAAEAEPPVRKPAASPATPPPSKPPRTQPSPPPTPTHPASKPTPSASKPSSTRPPTTVPARPSARVSPTASAPHHPSPPATRAPSSAQVTNAGGLQEPSTNVTTRSGRGRRRGCLIGCFLILLLSVLLAAGAPFVINILREEQQQRNLEPPPVQTR